MKILHRNSAFGGFFLLTLGAKLLRPDTPEGLDTAEDLDATEESDPVVIGARLLLGYQWKQRNEHNKETALALFVHTLNTISMVKCLATDERDYILSIWPDFARYEIPSGYRSLDAEELLGNALEQLHRTSQRFAPNYWPSGLLGLDSPTVSWFSMKGKSGRVIKHSRDLYAHFDFSNLVRTSNMSRLPLNLLNQEFNPQTLKIRLYTDYTEDLPLAQVLVDLDDAIQGCCQEGIDFLSRDEEEWSEEEIEQALSSATASTQVGGLKRLFAHIDAWKLESVAVGASRSCSQNGTRGPQIPSRSSSHGRRQRRLVDIALGWSISTSWTKPAQLDMNC